MTRRAVHYLLPCLFLAGLAGVPAVVAAPNPPASSLVRSDDFSQGVHSRPWSVVGDAASAGQRSSAAGSEQAYLVVLRGPTAFDLYARETAAQRVALPLAVAPLATDRAALSSRMIGQVEAGQEPIARDLTAHGATIVSRYVAAANGFLVYATPAEATAIATDPSVAAVHVAPFFLPTVEDAVPMIGADAVAAQLGYTGRDVVIAIVDTGIDYTHKSLGGTGRTRDFETVFGDPARVQRQYYPNDKVVGGYDFAGSAYGGGGAAAPDDNPIDERGHGSHVAGIAAGERGNRVLSHGVAPDALLLALKVFGRQGGTNLVVDALDWAVQANMGDPELAGICEIPSGCRVDVLNMSLGSPFADDVLDQIGAVRRAADAGILVVASAGNDYDVGFVTGSPAASPYALSVASSIPAGEKADQVQLLAADGSGELIEAVEASSSIAKGMVDIKNLRAPVAWMGRGCSGDPQIQPVSDKVALIELGGCTDQTKLAVAKAAGAVGVLTFLADTVIYQMDGSAKSDLPAFMIDPDRGTQLRQDLARGTPIEVVFSYVWNDTIDRAYLSDVVSIFSSRGPSRVDEFKPNIAAPGTAINAPAIGSGDQGTQLSGTSMSAPITSGAAAVLFDRLRSEGLAPPDEPLAGGGDASNLTAVDVGTLLVNGAQSTVWQEDSRRGVPVPLARAGAGRVDVAVSAGLDVALRAGRVGDPTTPFGLNFGVPTFAAALESARPFVVRNLSGADKTFALETRFVFEDDAGSGLSFAPSAATVTLAGGEAADLTLNLRGDAAAMKRYPLYGGDAAMVPADLTAAEHDAYLVATETDAGGVPVEGGDVARLPIYVLPRAASAISVTDGTIEIDPASGRGVGSAVNDGAQAGRVELYTPLGVDGTENQMPPWLDIDRVGARVLRDQQGDRVIEFLIHTRGTRHIPLQAQAMLAVDTDRNGSMDWVVFNEDIGLWPPTPFSRARGAQVAVATRIVTPSPLGISGNPGIYRADYYAGVDLESRTIVLPVQAAVLGFDDGDNVYVDVSARITSNYEEKIDGVAPDRYDSAPEGAWDVRGISGGRPWTFDERSLGYTVSPSSFNVTAGRSVEVRTTPLTGATGDPQPLLAHFPLNGPDDTRADDIGVIRVTRGDPPPTPTRASGTAIYLPISKNRDGGS